MKFLIDHNSKEFKEIVANKDDVRGAQEVRDLWENLNAETNMLASLSPELLRDYASLLERSQKSDDPAKIEDIISVRNQADHWEAKMKPVDPIEENMKILPHSLTNHFKILPDPNLLNLFKLPAYEKREPLLFDEIEPTNSKMVTALLKDIGTFQDRLKEAQTKLAEAVSDETQVLTVEDVKKLWLDIKIENISAEFDPKLVRGYVTLLERSQKCENVDDRASDLMIDQAKKTLETAEFIASKIEQAPNASDMCKSSNMGIGVILPPIGSFRITPPKEDGKPRNKIKIIDRRKKIK